MPLPATITPTDLCNASGSEACASAESPEPQRPAPAPRTFPPAVPTTTVGEDRSLDDCSAAVSMAEAGAARAAHAPCEASESVPAVTSTSSNGSWTPEQDAAIAAAALEMQQMYSEWLKSKSQGLRDLLRKQADGERSAACECSLCLLPLRPAADSHQQACGNCTQGSVERDDAAGGGDESESGGGCGPRKPGAEDAGACAQKAENASHLLVTTGCGHTFHLHCLRRAYELGHERCPECNAHIGPGVLPPTVSSSTGSKQRPNGTRRARWASAEGIGMDGRRLRSSRGNLPRARFGSSIPRFGRSTWGEPPSSMVHVSGVL